ncbi:ABC transporter permease [Streptomyces sp. NPDC047886]|uniref:ABC transporter permease n=1 Tax=Streptomyces sp. NPDC047886 TaxID=3365490 RepID=UPI00371ADA4C
MRAALTIAAKDLRQRFRDRSAWITVFLGPLAITAVIALAFGGTADFRADLGYVDLDRGAAATGLRRTLESPELAERTSLTSYASAEQARAAVDAGDVDAAVVVPEGFTASLSGRAPAALTVYDSVDNPLQAEFARAVSESFVAQIDADRLSVATAIAAGVPESEVPRLTEKSLALRLPETVEPQGLPDDPLKAVSYFAPSMGMFFVLFTVGAGARGYFTEQRDGTLDRVAATPVGAGSILLGKSLSAFFHSFAALGATLLAAWLLFGARWADPLGVVALCAATAMAVVCLTALVISLARSERQAEGLSSILVFALVLLGGNFVFSPAGPELLRKLALFTPNGWALRGFTDLGTGVGGLAAVGRPLLGIAAFCVVTAALAALLTRARRPS